MEIQGRPGLVLPQVPSFPQVSEVGLGFHSSKPGDVPGCWLLDSQSQELPTGIFAESFCSLFFTVFLLPLWISHHISEYFQALRLLGFYALSSVLCTPFKILAFFQDQYKSCLLSKCFSSPEVVFPAQNSTSNLPPSSLLAACVYCLLLDICHFSFIKAKGTIWSERHYFYHTEHLA